MARKASFTGGETPGETPRRSDTSARAAREKAAANPNLKSGHRGGSTDQRTINR